MPHFIFSFGISTSLSGFKQKTAVIQSKRLNLRTYNQFPSKFLIYFQQHLFNQDLINVFWILMLEAS